jgi:hypothetical protein
MKTLGRQPWKERAREAMQATVGSVGGRGDFSDLRIEGSMVSALLVQMLEGVKLGVL